MLKLKFLIQYFVIVYHLLYLSIKLQINTEKMSKFDSLSGEKEFLALPRKKEIIFSDGAIVCMEW